MMMMIVIIMTILLPLKELVGIGFDVEAPVGFRDEGVAWIK
jgi:hypothetical protein